MKPYIFLATLFIVLFNICSCVPTKPIKKKLSTIYEEDPHKINYKFSSRKILPLLATFCLLSYAFLANIDYHVNDITKYASKHIEIYSPCSFQNNYDHDWILSLKYRKYYKSNKKKFLGEGPSTKFKHNLINFINQETDIEKLYIMDIGANKGQIYDFNWVPNYQNHLKELLIICIEANPDLIINITNESNEYIKKRYNTSTAITTEAYNLLVGEKNNQTVYFKKNNKNSELSSLVYIDDNINNMLNNRKIRNPKYNSHIEYVKIPSTTLNSLVLNNSKLIFQNPKIFKILKIDTEGFDTLILYNGEKVIKYFDAILYESHILQKKEDKINGPGTTTYGAVIYFERNNFSLFKLGINISLPLSIKFYNPIYDSIMGWQNHIAFNKKSPYYNNLMLLLKTELPFPFNKTN